MSARPARRRASLRRQLGVVVLAFGTALGATYAVLIPELVTGTEDEVFEKQLDAWRAAARERLAAGVAPDRELVLGPGVRLFPGRAALGPELAGWIDALEPGVHEFNDAPLPGLAAREVFVAVEADPRSVLIFDVGPYEAFEGPWSTRYALSILGGTALAALGTVLGLVVLARVGRALGQLEQVAGTSAEDLAPVPLAAETRADEVGRIARAWRRGLERTRAALERERNFARDASHELRTPLTAAQGAVELLLAEGDADPGRRAELGERALAALRDAERRIATFLWLAREERPREPEPWPLAPLLAEVAAGGAHLELDPAVETDVAEAAARAVFDSLVANARRHGDGRLAVRLGPDSVGFENPVGPGAEGGGSHGFGLRLVSDLCARLGWRLETSLEADRFRATVHF